MSNFVSELDTPLLQLTKKDSFTLRDALQGVQVFGAIGSGKTTGAGKALSCGYLRAGMGGLVLCAKPEEVDLWKSYCQQHGREQDMILFDEKKGFNFINWEFSRKGTDGVSSVADTILRLIKTAELAAGQGGGKEGEQFWINATRDMIKYSIAALYGANGSVSVREIVKFVSTMPTRPPANAEEGKALASNYAIDVLTRFKNSPIYPAQPDLLETVLSYWTLQYVGLADKTRSSILINVTSTLNRFNTGMLSKCFCGDTSIVPEMTFAGKIIIMNFPVLTHNEEGLIAQQLFKLIFQRAVESRNGLDPIFAERPVFLYADESQFFVSQYDDTFLSTCRGSRCAIVYLTQSLPTYYAQLGKEKSDAVDGFVGKFTSKIFHLQSCPRTNKYASELIGRGIKIRRTTGEQKGKTLGRSKTSGRNASSQYTYGGSSLVSGAGGENVNSNQNGGSGSSSGYTMQEGESLNVNSGTTEQMDDLLPANWFSQNLKSGGAGNNFEVTALWFKAGGKFHLPLPDVSNNVILATFNQR